MSVHRVEERNSLPDDVISTNKLKTVGRKLDKYWQTQPLVYEYLAELYLKAGSKDYIVEDRAEALDIEESRDCVQSLHKVRSG